MKVELDRLVVTRVLVDLPEICTNVECGADLREEGALMEGQYVGSDQACQIVDTDEGPSLDGHDSYDSDVSPAFAISYSCTACSTVLVTADDEGAEEAR